MIYVVECTCTHRNLQLEKIFLMSNTIAQKTDRPIDFVISPFALLTGVQ